MNRTLSLVRQHSLSIVLVTLIGVVASIGFTLLQKPQYRSSFTLLVLEQQNNLDGYTAAKSAERLSASLGQLMYTTTFTDQVYQRIKSSELLAGDPLFTATDMKRQTLWKRSIETRIQPDVGMLQIAVYHANRSASTIMANTLATVLVEQGTNYLGGGQDVQLKVVNYPLTTERPARPDVVLNVLAGLLLGLGASLGYIALAAMRPTLPLQEQQTGSPQWQSVPQTHQMEPQSWQPAENLEPTVPVEQPGDFQFNPVARGTVVAPSVMTEEKLPDPPQYTVTYQQPGLATTSEENTWRMP